MKSKKVAYRSVLSKSITALCILLLPIVAGANTDNNVAQTTTITQMYTYGTYETSDTRYRNEIVVKVVNPIGDCSSGYYLSADDNLNNPSLASFLLSAFHASTTVRFGARKDQLWHGSSGKYCRIANVSLIK